jgi:dipeptidyl aminopeptidase/acylaminoacyl peptidase
VILHIPGSVLFYIGFSPTTGDLLFEQAKAPNDGIWAVPFSPSKLQTTGTPTLVQANGANASISRNGTLVYLNGLSRDSELVWVDRAGKILQHIGTPEQDMREPAVAPDGVHVAVDGKSYGELLVQDANRNAAVKINFGAGDIGSPQWAPDGKTLAFIIRRKGGRSLAVAFPDNSRTVHEIPISAGVGDFTFTRDGKNLLIECKPDETWGICKMALQDGAVPEKLIFRPGDAARPQLSPDGHFLAYQSDESGRWEIYVQPFPTGQGRWQISTAGGVLPKWNPSGKELAYLDGQKLMVVPVETKSAFVPGLPRALFSGETLRTAMQLYGSPLYDYSADGQKFVIVRAVTSDMLDIIAIQNLLPGKKPAP